MPPLLQLQAERRGQPYVLLDRDERFRRAAYPPPCALSVALLPSRFTPPHRCASASSPRSFLSSFRAFDLDEPAPLDEPFDAIFCARPPGAPRIGLPSASRGVGTRGGAGARTS